MATQHAGPENEDEEFHTLFTTFLDKTVSRPFARDHLRRVLEGLPGNIRSTSLLPIDDMELRIEYINRLEEFWRLSFEKLTKQSSAKVKRFCDVQFAALYLMDFQQLKRYATGEAHERDVCYLLECLEPVPALVKLMTGKKTSDEEAEMAERATYVPDLILLPPSQALAPLRRLSQQSNPPRFESQTGRAKRNEAEADARKMLDDHRCILTKQSFPHACHIIGYAVNMSDRKWNMLSLNPTLHGWWSRGCFGLKWIGLAAPRSADPEEIQTVLLQFEWLMWRARPVGERKPAGQLGRTAEEIKAAFPDYSAPEMMRICGNPALPDPYPLLAMCRPATGWNIEHGEVFEARIQQKYVMNMKLCVDIQQSINRLIAMAGGAEALDDLPDKPEFLNEDGRFPGLVQDFLHTHKQTTLAMRDEDKDAGKADSEDDNIGNDGIIRTVLE
ncbi:hypothetical protein B0T26DRAFT_752765 [Lasiosphaeria miniovina]|uniref:HNH nuclease domain-containing protein n=1 Tax=Lasiosphaeria miniovina TaxID=1954250 RepID=A0AA40AB33_9PEZI|nr:uncharacterized protein B0T26DRAFT_752765 [Lasiosphaeria miniovina]KAK0712539.1 hypothetical protein B0T26DRAFT_752765 [Lasiosphaeria miniovina]